MSFKTNVRASLSHLVAQAPWSTWNQSDAKLETETGFQKDEILDIARQCSDQLLLLRMRKRQKRKKNGSEVQYLSPMNILLLTLNWLWRYPPLATLAANFCIHLRRASEYAEKGVLILWERLSYLREWPATMRSRITKGRFKDVVGFVDSTPICIPKPKEKKDQKKFFLFKRKETKWA